MPPTGSPGNLNERAEIAVKLARDEPGNLLGDEIVVGVQSRRGRRILVRLRMGEGWHVHRGDRRALPVAAAHRIAADLEAPAEGGEFGKSGVAGRARLSGLAGVARQRLSRSDAGGEKSRRRDDERRDAESENANPRPHLVQRDRA